MIFGSLVALGASSLWPLTWPILLYRLLQLKQWPQIEWRILLIILPVALSAFWSHTPGYTVFWSVNLLLLAVTLPHIKSHRYYLVPIGVMLLVHTGISIVDYVNGESRASGLTTNSGILALAGLATWPIGGLLVGLSVSRVEWLVGFLLIWWGKRTMPQYLFFGGLWIMILSFMVFQTPNRFGIENLKADFEKREETLNASSVESNPCGEYKSVRLVFLGYGFGSFCYATGRSVPHNVFVLSGYELGILSIPFWIGCGLIWWKYSRNWKLLFVLLLIGNFGPELFARVEGQYVVLGLTQVVGGGRLNSLEGEATSYTG